MLIQPTLATLNHLLAQSGWALARLTKFNGKTARFRVAPFSVACTIQNDGSLCEAAQDASADAELNIAPSLLPRLALSDDAAFAQITSAGDAALIEEILFLAHNLRWDAAEDVSRLTGDIAAERIVNLAKVAHQQVRTAALNLSQAAAEYWTEERPMVTKPVQLAGFERQVSQLRDEVERLEQRIQALSPSHSPTRGRGEK